MQDIQPQALTVRYKGLSRILHCIPDPQVSLAFDPRTTPTRPQHHQFKGIWDTGATDTVITQNVVDTCGLKPIGMAIVNTASGQANQPVFLINLLLPNNVEFTLRVTLGQMKDANILIGMDVICRGDFVITNKDAKTVVSFRIPSTQCIDFVKEINEAKAAPGQTIKLPPKIGQNAPCPCGSGKKYKRCCGKKS